MNTVAVIMLSTFLFLVTIVQLSGAAVDGEKWSVSGITVGDKSNKNELKGSLE